MAANSQRLGLTSFGKRFLSHICSRDSGFIPSLSLRRGVHVSAYDKNPEEHVHSTVVPDYLILPQSDKYWAPHPQTGVFGPATDHNPAAGGERGFHSLSMSANGDSVLEQKAFFRHLEDLEKPPHP
ncbi:hypothetical protein Adt_12699 [Abeliophyllum distichum]|uniref:Uncharacterized protein n=1 Tax=Abeliophyllum distichum TaxID=126358 RepID=A0ABD1USZ7_9LAMI